MRDTDTRTSPGSALAPRGALDRRQSDLASPEDGDPIHRIPASHTWLCRASGGFFALLGLASLATPWIWPGSFTALYVAAPVLVGSGLISRAGFLSALRAGTRYRVDEDGLVAMDESGAESVLRWRDVSTVRMRPILQRLELADARGARSFRLDFQLTGFERLVTAVARSVYGRDTPRNRGVREFRRGPFRWLVLATAPLWPILSVGFLGGVLMVVWVISAVQVGIWMAGWRRIRIEGSRLFIERPIGVRRIPSTEIAEVGLVVQGHNGGTALPAVVVVLDSDEILRFHGVREGTLRLFARLDRLAPRVPAGGGSP